MSHKAKPQAAKNHKGIHTSFAGNPRSTKPYVRQSRCWVRSMILNMISTVTGVYGNDTWYDIYSQFEKYARYTVRCKSIDILQYSVDIKYRERNIKISFSGCQEYSSRCPKTYLQEEKRLKNTYKYSTSMPELCFNNIDARYMRTPGDLQNYAVVWSIGAQMIHTTMCVQVHVKSEKV